LNNEPYNQLEIWIGFGPGGAKLEDVQLMKSVVGDSALVKASGGIKTYQDARQFLLCGASRIGIGKYTLSHTLPYIHTHTHTHIIQMIESAFVSLTETKKITFLSILEWETTTYSLAHPYSHSMNLIICVYMCISRNKFWNGYRCGTFLSLSLFLSLCITKR
jgi:hypothetical protein